MTTKDVAEPGIVEVEPGGEVDRLLSRANGGPLVLVWSGERYRLERETPEQAAREVDNSERVQRILRETAGGWKGIDAEALKAVIRAQRGQDSHGRPG